MRKLLVTVWVMFNLNLVISNCQQKPAIVSDNKEGYIINKDHPNPRMRFKVLDSYFSQSRGISQQFIQEITKFGGDKYEKLKPLILEKSIPEIQKMIGQNLFNYRDLCLFFLYRIHMYESNPDLCLNALISINPNVIRDAEEKDIQLKSGKIPSGIFGMPILVKDNIGVEGMPTTAGAAIMAENYTQNAFIISRLIEKGAVILGKANLSEWAYYFCNGCPLGYSAMGGQSLNPYGRLKIETGGSSSGSGTAVAANYAIAAVGTETSGSILSPASMNSVVGMKPTVGLLSRSGIIPISSTLDTPGPMTRSVIDNTILMDAMTGYDPEDLNSDKLSGNIEYYKLVQNASWDDFKFVGLKNLSVHELYLRAIHNIAESGGKVNEIEVQPTGLTGFLTLLNLDMKHDLPHYIKKYSNLKIEINSIKDIIQFNRNALGILAPYGQGIFENIVSDTTSEQNFLKIKNNLKSAGQEYLNAIMEKGEGDIILSINNFHAAFAAVSFYPAITIPIGLNSDGEPTGLTLIAKSGEELKLYQAAYLIEQGIKGRVIPENYR